MFLSGLPVCLEPPGDLTFGGRSMALPHLSLTAFDDDYVLEEVRGPTGTPDQAPPPLPPRSTMGRLMSESVEGQDPGLLSVVIFLQVAVQNIFLQLLSAKILPRRLPLVV